MRALTVRQPWAWAIAEGLKTVENRSRKPPEGHIGTRIAIHAGKAPYRTTFATPAEDLTDKGWPPSLLLPMTACNAGAVYGAVIAVATLAGWVNESGEASLIDFRGWPRSVIGSPWFTGPFGWVLTDVVKLSEPVPARGQLGLWTLPEDVEAAVVDQRIDMFGGPS
jgi:hypothetical protein